MAQVTPSSLIDAIQSAFGPKTDDINPLIRQYVLRPGVPYLSPAHIMSAQKAQSGVPYWMQGIAMQTCNNQYITAPPPLQASIITHAATVMYGNGYAGTGAAPTSGVFTGVEGSC